MEARALALPPCGPQIGVGPGVLRAEGAQRAQDVAAQTAGLDAQAFDEERDRLAVPDGRGGIVGGGAHAPGGVGEQAREQADGPRVPLARRERAERVGERDPRLVGLVAQEVLARGEEAGRVGRGEPVHGPRARERVPVREGRAQGLERGLAASARAADRPRRRHDPPSFALEGQSVSAAAASPSRSHAPHIATAAPASPSFTRPPPGARSPCARRP
jgi:hypothetical protein